MATGRDNGDEYHEQLKCGICLDIVKTPKSLQCTHTFCFTCLDGWIKANRRNRNRKYPCPTCKDPHDIPQNGANAYKTNVMVQGIVDIVDRKRKLNEGDTIECDICIQDNLHSPALARCMECAENMCQACKRAHGLSRGTKSHELYKLTGNADEDSKTALAHLSSRNINCSEHPDQPLLFFCKEDKIPVCRDCCITEHSKHESVKIETISEPEKERIAALVELIKEKK
ncbi:unnamed protein product [Owenia fusiformis]|uniref:Uncharacterized protein n=1 Tax=Owenia fusiformis TaxID=6347 RepID=A0A8J1UBR6_OWEFU|nr:unnamed protein product [Owenia fusiformis]